MPADRKMLIASADLCRCPLLCWGTSRFTLRCLFSIGANVNTVEKYKHISVIMKIVLTLQTPERLSRGIQGPHFENLLVPVKLLMSQRKTVMDCVLIHHVFPLICSNISFHKQFGKTPGTVGTFLRFWFRLGWVIRTFWGCLQDALGRPLQKTEGAWASQDRKDLSRILRDLLAPNKTFSSCCFLLLITSVRENAKPLSESGTILQTKYMLDSDISKLEVGLWNDRRSGERAERGWFFCPNRTWKLEVPGGHLHAGTPQTIAQNPT